jgi:hypothetical protein
MDMNKIEINIRYKMIYQFTWVVWTLAIYLVAMFLVFYFLIKFSAINHSEGSLVYRIWILVIFQFAISMRFKEDFDFFLTLSNTRNEIFLSLLGVAFGFSALFSGLIALERLIVDYLNNILGYNNIIDPFHFFSPYGSDNIYLQFVFFLVLSFCCSIFGLLIGSLSYRFGKKFTLAFWLIFSALPMMFFPWLLWQGQILRFITDIGDFFKNFDVLAGSGYLFILSIVFSIAAYLNIRRLPQK